jgi:hypothetical protein
MGTTRLIFLPVPYYGTPQSINFLCLYYLSNVRVKQVKESFDSQKFATLAIVERLVLPHLPFNKKEEKDCC